MNLEKLMHAPEPESLSEMFGELDDLDDADIEDGIVGLFESALDSDTGILVPCLVREWPDLLESEGSDLEEMVGPELAHTMELFRVGYAVPKPQRAIAFGRPDRIARSKEWPTPDINQTLRYLARALRNGRERTAQKLLGAIGADPVAFKRIVGPHVVMRSVHAYDLAREDQLRLGLVWNGRRHR